MESQVSDLGYDFDIVGGLDTKEPEEVQEAPAPKEPEEDVSSVKDMMSSSDKTFAGGDRNCYLYVSINLTVNSRFGTPISIGAIAPDGDTFYAESTDYEMKYVDTDVFVNVVKNLVGNDNVFKTIVKPTVEIRKAFTDWVYSKFAPNNKMVQIVMDKVEWDWPILKEFISSEFKGFPKWISPIVIDLNSDLANTVTIEKDKLEASIKGEGDLANFIPALEIYKSIDRVETATSIGNVNQMIMLAHNSNALKKAMCIRAIHQNLWGFGEA